jgi:hypothetical protein
MYIIVRIHFLVKEQHCFYYGATGIVSQNDQQNARFKILRIIKLDNYISEKQI